MDLRKVLVIEFETDPSVLQNLLQILGSSSGIRHQIECRSIQSTVDELPSLITGKKIEAQTIVLAASSLQILRQICSIVPLIKRNMSNIPIMAVMDSEDPEMIVELLKCGIDDFVTLPLKHIEIVPRLFRLLDKYSSQDTVQYELKEKFGMRQLIGVSASFLMEVEKIPLLAKCDVGVLICGETGTGKELCARAIHYLSPRCSRPFIPVNCGAIPADLVENELFGHTQGAFTGASTSKPGLIQEAEGGTIFLDEIDCLSLVAQVKLLRFLQEKEYRALGSGKTKRADVRVLAAMNSDFQEALSSGKLRQDLYYRLSVIPLVLPPLRQRPEDIPLLASHFREKYSREFRKPITNFSTQVMEMLATYEWPGNVRELENVVERAVLFAESDTAEAKDIHFASSAKNSYESFRDAKTKVIAEFEKSYIERLLVVHQGNVTKAAHEAKKNRRAFWELVRKHHIDLHAFRNRVQ